MGGHNLKLLFLDTVGQQKYKTIDLIYYKDYRVALLVYDLISPHFFASLQQWAEGSTGKHRIERQLLENLQLEKQ